MAGPLSWTVDDTAGYVVVAVRGDLAPDGTPLFLSALLKCLADQPDALLVDLVEMDAPDPATLAVFAEVERQAARWPGTPVLLCAPRPAVRRQLDRDGLGTLRLHDSVAEALLAVAGDLAVVSAVSDQLLPVSGAVRHARDLATEACSAWDLPHLVGPASLVVSELVSNAIEHAGTMMTVRFTRRGGFLHISVRDGSPAEPVLNPPAVVGSVSRGHGLVLVDSVAAHWGSLPTSDGKVVWAALPIT